MLIRAAHLTFSMDKFWCDFWRRETGFVSVYRVHNYASPQTAESQQSVQTLVQKTPPLSEFLVAYWPIPYRNLSLTLRVILLTVVSSLLTEARLYEFSRHLEYYLWYTLANSPISFWNRLSLPLPWPNISFGTLHLLLEPRRGKKKPISWYFGGWFMVEFLCHACHATYTIR